MAWRRKARSVTAGDWRFVGSALSQLTALADIKSTAFRGDGDAGTLNMALWTLLSGLTFPAAANVSNVETTWGPGGVGYGPGLIDLTTLQLKTDSVLIAAISATIVKDGETITATSGATHVDGTYSPGGTYVQGQTAQLATDQGVVAGYLENIDGGVTILGQEGTGVNATTAQAAAAAALAAYNTTGVAKEATLGKVAPRLIGTLSGAGTGTEICVYAGVTATYTVDEDGNITNVAFT
jgi:hypothetical protein